MQTGIGGDGVTDSADWRFSVTPTVDAHTICQNDGHGILFVTAFFENNRQDRNPPWDRVRISFRLLFNVAPREPTYTGPPAVNTVWQLRSIMSGHICARLCAADTRKRLRLAASMLSPVHRSQVQAHS